MYKELLWIFTQLPDDYIVLDTETTGLSVQDNELIEISDVSHERVFDVLYFVPTDTPCDESAIWVHMRCLAEKCFEVSFVLEDSLQSYGVISCEPHDDLIDFGFGASLFLYFCDIEWIDTRE